MLDGLQVEVNANGDGLGGEQEGGLLFAKLREVEEKPDAKKCLSKHHVRLRRVRLRRIRLRRVRLRRGSPFNPDMILGIFVH